MDIKSFLKSDIGLIVIAIIALYVIVTIFTSGFTGKLMTPMSDLNNLQPRSFPPLDQKHDGFPPLANPVVPEEIGLAMVYPQGEGVGDSDLDSNSFGRGSGNPGPLLTSYTTPESYGESSLTDPNGTKGAEQGARVLRISSTGNQMNFKPSDDSIKETYSSAYTDGEVPTGPQMLNGSKEIDYSDSFNPEAGLYIQTSPGQYGTVASCEITYPNVTKYQDFCITDGDIPYGKVVNGKVNPRLVSKWQSFTGDYSRDDALKGIDGLLYPSLNVMTTA